MATTYKLIIAGSREFTDMNHLERILVALIDTELADKELVVLSSMERGAGALGYQLANLAKLKTEEYPAHWHRYGKKAAYMRDSQMCKDADGMLLVASNASDESAVLYKEMRNLNKPIFLTVF